MDIPFPLRRNGRIGRTEDRADGGSRRNMQNMVYHAVETSHVYENTGVNVREWTGRSNIFDKSSRLCGDPRGKRGGGV